jgi:prepilin peptidase CpaA
MVSATLLFALLLTATVTDVRWGTIYNWTTYPGMLAALIGSGAASLFGLDSAGLLGTETPWWGFVPFEESLFGLLACGAVMTACYVFLPGIGGGDVKLIAMLGAFLGVQAGLEAMLWTFVIGACFAIVILIWQAGILTLLKLIGKYLYRVIALKTLNPLSPEERAPLKTNLYLSPSALSAVVIVYFQLMELF